MYKKTIFHCRYLSCKSATTFFLRRKIFLDITNYDQQRIITGEIILACENIRV